MKQKYGIVRDEYWPDSGGVLGSDYLEVWYPVGRTTVTHGMRVFVEMGAGTRALQGVFRPHA